jgi:hypothetical protein
MPVNFATPVAHQTTANYAAFNNAITLGRPFRQPLLTAPNPADFSSGWELFLSSAGDVAVVYAWLDGTLTWQASATAAPGNRLTLETDVRVRTGNQALPRLRIVEAHPARAIYENVDQASVQTALEAVLNAAYAAAVAAPRRPNNWHPAMRLQVLDGTTNRRLKEYLDAHAPAATTITALITGFLGGAAAAGGVVLRQLPVLAGEALGRAAPYLAGDPLPAAPSFPLGGAADANRARRLTFVTQDNCRQSINPLYYHHVFMRRMLLPANQRVVVSLTNIVANGALAHPLVTLFPALSAAAVPVAREQINGQSRIPIGDLGTFHGYPAGAPVSQLEWRYAATGEFEAQARVAGTAVPTLAPTTAQTTRVNTLWTTYGAAIATICDALQVPCEAVIGLVCTEAPPNLDERAVRFEPLRERDRNRLRTGGVAAADELEYDKVVGLQGTVTAATHNANGTTRLDVTLTANRTWAANVLRSRNVFVLVDEADRLPVTANGAGSNTSTYRITVRDRKLAGGFANRGTQAFGTTLFYAPGQRGAGNAAAGPVQLGVQRQGEVRRLRVTAGANTLDGPATVTVFQNGAATALTVTLAAGAQAGNDTANTFVTAAGDDLSVQVTTAGTAGTITNLRWELLHAPAAAPAGGAPPGDVWVLEGHSTSVPSPWNGPGLLRAGRTMTWAQVLPIIEQTRGERVSPGLLQTLISTASGITPWLNAVAGGLFAALGIPAPPATAADFLNDWLTHGARSILVGIAYIRSGYNTRTTCFDLPLVGAAYNAGTLRTRGNTRWGLQYHGEYVERAGPHFNAGTALFNAAAAPATTPTVRLMS